MKAIDLLTSGAAGATKLEEQAARVEEMFRLLGREMAPALNEQLLQLVELARGGMSPKARREIEALFPNVVQGLAQISDAVDQLMVAGAPLVELVGKLQAAVARVN